MVSNFSYSYWSTARATNFFFIEPLHNYMTIDHIIQKYPTPIREDTFTAIVISNFQCKPNRKRFRIETTVKMS